MWSYCILILEQKKKHCWLLALSSYRNVVFSELTKLYPTHACREHNYVWPLLAQNCGYRWVFVAWDSIRRFWGNKEKRETKRAGSDSEFSLFYDFIVSCKQIALPHRFSLSTVLLSFSQRILRALEKNKWKKCAVSATLHCVVPVWQARAIVCCLTCESHFVFVGDVSTTYCFKLLVHLRWRCRFNRQKHQSQATVILQALHIA